jgi:hypothetical protein
MQDTLSNSLGARNLTTHLQNRCYKSVGVTAPQESSTCILVIVSVGLQFGTENGGNMILRNITKQLPYHTALIPEEIITMRTSNPSMSRSVTSHRRI